VQAPSQLKGGDQVTVTAIGTPRGKASLTIEGLLDKVPMPEIRDGVYETSYTVRRSDNIAASKVTVKLNKGNSSEVSMDYSVPLILDALPPVLTSTQPLNGAVVSDRLSSIIATYGDGAGSGVNTQGIKLLVNGVDVSSAATINSGFLTYKPSSPFKENAVNLELQVSDKAGNASNLKWSFSFDKPYQP
ncbi:MAG: Ig-like domain-containing protein, partial [Candidatus Obscuribacterales bacterium]|nr:Ig-like domain-containing protein [Candidatus Obscuribacterales bacterium]